MGTLKDVFDIVNSAETEERLLSSLRNKKYSSISKRASEGILLFPVIASDSIDIETLQMVSKALERNYSTFIMVSISMSPTISTDEDIVDYLRKFHTNKGQTRRDKFDAWNIITPHLESYKCIADEENNRVIFYNIFENSSTPAIMKELKFDNNGGFMAGLESTILNNMVVIEGKSGKNSYKDHRHKKGDKRKNVSPGRQAFIDIGYDNYSDNYDDSALSGQFGEVKLDNDGDVKNDKRFNDKKSKKTKHGYNNTSTHVGGYNDVSTHNGGFNDTRTITHTGGYDDKRSGGFNDTKTIVHKGGHNDTRTVIQKREGGFKDTQTVIQRRADEDLSKGMLTDNDVKKANELVPTMLHIRLKMINKGKENADVGYVDFMLGIKAHLHPVKHQEMMTNLLQGLKNKGKFFNFIRWTTGEISFFKDFLFGIKDIKKDVSDRSAGADSFWLDAKRRRALSKINDKMIMKNRIMPNSTIVVSMDEADYIKSEYGYDLLNENVAYKLIDEYFLLGFVVVDSATQVIHFLFEGKTSYESISFSGLERENANDSKKFKEMLKAINRN